MMPWDIVTFTDLPPATLGQTTAQQITLDTDAANHGWYIDYTPYLNEEFLPTSNPNEWIAKPGSEAEGRMDLLSVLLHEYGHVLGLDHNANGHDFMATTLAPGVRRLPSAEELAQLNALSVAVTDPADPTPETPPGLPLGASLGALLVGRLRRSDYGWSTAFEQAQVTTAAPQYEIAANPKLENPVFDNSGAGWSTQGAVAFTNGAAVLTETAATQTRLNQVFVLGEQDRFLSFTLANSSLGDQANGPDDAFEVALLDANSGLSLLGGTGLSHNDAILNRQADGSEHKASGISRIDNADGSHTYLIDLAGIPAGTTLNLAFDLIGFGRGAEATNSRLTIRDLRLGLPLEARDDAARTDEDTPVLIDVLGNDLGAGHPGVRPVLLQGPDHGLAEVTPDGQLRYTPAADWSGEDRFRYQLSDGQANSSIATVTLTVTPVNDAPTAGDQSL
ncbi:MAG: cadherin-like domain-containing protein [Gammaproteobacteria bacterium]|nr:cadherin-like domain-containing protein [Gammaproteobacteria bacterium]MBU1656448.1 cadherin-like domain-containing protein [Gammaproteobacteria bacterium]MBU1961472.1 cadherin-like domain-containing protein [Gammaproteobacteria bacterium]